MLELTSTRKLDVLTGLRDVLDHTACGLRSFLLCGVDQRWNARSE